MNTLRKIRKPELVFVNDRPIVSSGRFNPGLMADYVNEHGREDWLSIGDLARVAYGQNVKRSQKAARKALPGLFWTLFAKGELLIYDYRERGRIEAVKICDISKTEDRQRAEERVNKMQQRKELTTEQYHRARCLLEVIHKESEEVTSPLFD